MILAVLSSRYPNSGAEAFLGVELKSLQRQFDRVIVVPVRDSLFARRTLADAFFVVRSRPRRLLALLRTVLLTRSRPIVVLKNLLVLPKALAVARLVERERVDHIHAYWLSAPATVALVASQLTGIRWSSSAHRWDIYENNLLERKANSATFIRAISDRGRRDLTRSVGGENRGKIHRIRVGVELPVLERGAEKAALRILCAANLIEQKGHTDLIAALAILAGRSVDFTCDIAGSGVLFERLRDEIARRGLESRVRLQGRVDHSALLERLRSGEYDVAALASRDFGSGRMEGVPVALAEAMAAGLPCVATDSGSIPELLDTTCGFIVKAGDRAAIADALERLARSRELRIRLGNNARVRIAENFNLARTGPALGALIRSA